MGGTVPSPGEDAPQSRMRRLSWRTWLVIALIAIVLAMGGFVVRVAFDSAWRTP